MKESTFQTYNTKNNIFMSFFLEINFLNNEIFTPLEVFTIFIPSIKD